MLGRLMTEWLTSSAQCEEAPDKVRLLKSERKTESFCFSSSLFRRYENATF
ncbi:hypothetical protein N9D57_01315 [bacterium]|nr:hypothetical protein [bacterium]